MQITRRIQWAWSKLRFAAAITTDFWSFLRLLTHTKQYNWCKQKEGCDRTIAGSYQLRSNELEFSLSLRKYTGDITVFYENFWEKIYSHPVVKNQPIQTVLDLGAHVGCSALYFLSQFPGSTIYAVEADPDNFRLLQTNLSSANFSNRVSTIHAAISDHNGKLYLQKQHFSYNSRVSEEPGSYAVNAITVSSLLEQYHIPQIDLLKIDIEGWEDVVLQQNNSWLKKVQFIVMECHSLSTRNKCQQILLSHGFEILPTVNHNEFLDLLWAKRAKPSTG